MAAFAIDTLRFTKRLEAAGVGREQAEAQAVALSEAVSDGLVTKVDLTEAVFSLRGEIRDGKTDVPTMKWMLGFTLAGILAIAVRLFAA